MSGNLGDQKSWMSIYPTSGGTKKGYIADNKNARLKKAAFGDDASFFLSPASYLPAAYLPAG
jgi:hypothetical protein